MFGILKNKKARPWIIGAMILVGVIVLFVMMRARGSSGGEAAASAGGPSEALQAAQLQASTQLAMGQLQANVEMARTAGEIEVALGGQAASLQLAQYEAQTAQYIAGAQANISLAGIASQTQIAEAAERTQQRGIAAQQNVQLAGIASQTQMIQAQYAFMTEDARLDSQTEIARINAQAKTARRQSDNSLFGSIIGAGLAFFSDVRLKHDVTWTGEHLAREPGGRGFNSVDRYSWTYHGDPKGVMSYGVMAQQITRVAPQAIVASRTSRYLAVDYGALPV